MTVPTEVSESIHAGNGVANSFSTGFTFIRASEVKVYLTPVGGSPTLQTLGVHYTLTMPTAPGNNGSVLMMSTPLAGEVLTIRREVPLTQLTDLRNVGSFSPAVHEDQFDELVFIDQQLARRVSALESAGAPGAVVAGDGLEFVDPTTLAVNPGDGLMLSGGEVKVVLTAVTPSPVGAFGGSAGAGVEVSRGDHSHEVLVDAPPSTAVRVGNAADLGASLALARADHQHAVASAAPVAVTKAANAEGVAVTFARSDHKHDVSTAAPGAITDSTNAEGSATSLARSDHQHAHGVRGGGTLHAEATGAVAGFMPAALFAALTGAKPARTHVRAWQSVLQAVAHFTSTTIIFDTEEYDTEGEYNAGTGVFTADEAGYYLVTCRVGLAAVAWLTTSSITMVLVKSGTPAGEVGTSDLVETAATRGAQLHLASVVYLTAGQTLQVVVLHNQGGPVNTVAQRIATYLTIDRLL